MAHIEFDYSELEGKIKAVFKTQDAMAEAMGMSRSALNQRLNNVVNWKTKELITACGLLKIPLNEAHIFFLTQKQ